MDEPFTSYDSARTDVHESFVEAELRCQLLKVLADEARFSQHVPVDTPNGTFAIACVVDVGGHRVGFEVDAPGDRDRKRADWRDAAVLATGVADAIVHLAEFDVLWYPRDALHLISRVEPAMFSPRGRIILERLAHPEVRRAVIAPGDERLSAIIWRKQDELEPDISDHPHDEKPSDALSASEPLEPREEEPGLERMLSAHRRRDPQSSHRLDVIRHRKDGRLKPVIARVLRQVERAGRFVDDA
jgi:hypothetical protein